MIKKIFFNKKTKQCKDNRFVEKKIKKPDQGTKIKKKLIGCKLCSKFRQGEKARPRPLKEVLVKAQKALKKL